MPDLNHEERIWSCRIGFARTDELPDAADSPMRDAVYERFEEITGHRPDFIFSGWGDVLGEAYRAAHEDRMPEFEVVVAEAVDALREEGLLDAVREMFVPLRAPEGEACGVANHSEMAGRRTCWFVGDHDGSHSWERYP